MRKLLFLFVFLVILSFSSTNASGHMLFPQFEEGYARTRCGGRAIAQFNYNKERQRMLFVNSDGETLELDSDNVVAVRIGQRTFIPSGSNDAFYERISINGKTLFVRHRVDTHYALTPVAYGISMETRRVNLSEMATSHLVFGGPTEVQRIDAVLTEYTGTPTMRTDVINVTEAEINVIARMGEGVATNMYRDRSVVLIHNGNRFIEINALRNLTRQFSRTQRSQIENFARQNNTDFRNFDDVKAIVVYALSLRSN